MWDLLLRCKIQIMELQNHSLRIWLAAGLMLGVSILCCGPAQGQLDISGQQAGEPLTLTDAAPAENERAALISCKGLIDYGLYQSLRRRTQIAIDEGATYLIYEIGTYGGLLQSGDDISKYFILEVGKEDVRTVAFITTEAISAGAMISVGCQDIIMLKNATIGDCAPISLTGQIEGVEREKVESFTRVTFSRAAEANGYPEALLKAMVSQRLEVYRVKNKKSGEFEFFEQKDLPDDAETYDLEKKKLVVDKDTILSLTASEAKEYGIARAIVEDLDGALAFLAERDGVTFEKGVTVFEMLWSEHMVRWVNSPAVMGVLVMLAMLGVYVELNSPGLGLPGLVAVICVVIIVGSKYLVGMANWLEVAIFILGVILLGIEIFVIPGFGVAGIAGVICIFTGLFGMLIANPPDRFPWPKPEFGGWEPFLNGLVGLSFGFVGFLVLAWLFAKYLPKSRFLSGLSLAPAAGGPKLRVSMTAAPATDKASSGAEVSPIGINAGDIGIVVSPLRPAGQARFGAAVVDVVTEGEFLEKDVEVEVLDVHGNRVLVRETQK